MIVRYIYSACMVIETSDLRICCDPWFTQGIYGGSWFQYPQVSDPIKQIGKIDFIYISHIHPDHYDPPYLRALLIANPECQILIGNENQHFLRAKMERDGFQPREISHISVGTTEIIIVPNYCDGEVNIDSALAVKNKDHSVVNLNDCSFDPKQVEVLKSFCGKNPDLACLPYAGAGLYPQMYRFEHDSDRRKAADQKKEQFLTLFGIYFDAFSPRFAMPCAGLYYLGGSLYNRNEDRGVPDAVEVRERYGAQIIVLSEGFGSINLSSGEVVGLRTEKYSAKERDIELSRLDRRFFYQDEEDVGEPELLDLLAKSHVNAVARIKEPSNRWICFKTPVTQYLCVRADSPGKVERLESPDQLCNREEIFIDSRLLKGLLLREFHWNNAEIGSHFEILRSPEVYDRRIYNLLNFLHV